MALAEKEPKKPTMSIANIITLSRVPLLLLLVGLLYLPWGWSILTALVLLPVLFLMDWLDGYVARSKNQVTDLGSVLDIAIDRVVENTLWLAFAHLGRVPIWIPILFIIRSFVIDGLRGYALSRGQSAFGMMHSRWGRFLVSGRFMRGLYGLAKGSAFTALIMGQALTIMGPEELAISLPSLSGLIPWMPWVEGVTMYLAAALCLARGVPVLLDVRKYLGTELPTTD